MKVVLKSRADGAGVAIFARGGGQVLDIVGFALPKGDEGDLVPIYAGLF